VFVFGEFKARTERRGEGARGGDGVGDHVKLGVGGCDVTPCVHVLEHTVHVVEAHTAHWMMPAVPGARLEAR